MLKDVGVSLKTPPLLKKAHLHTLLFVTFVFAFQTQAKYVKIPNLNK